LPPTQAAIEPQPGAKFDGVFTGGEITFRTSQNGKQVIPKSVRVRKATCQQGKTVSDLIAFDPPPSFPITDGEFTMSKGDIITISGMFTSPSNAQGSLVIHLKAGGTACTVGPVAWSASAP
jgi:hypothetical protein